MSGTLPHGYNPETQRPWTIEELWPDLTQRQRLERFIENSTDYRDFVVTLNEQEERRLKAQEAMGIYVSSVDRISYTRGWEEIAFLDAQLEEARRLLLALPPES